EQLNALVDRLRVRGGLLQELSPVRASLEDVFVGLVAPSPSLPVPPSIPHGGGADRATGRRGERANPRRHWPPASKRSSGRPPRGGRSSRTSRSPRYSSWSSPRPSTSTS